MKTKIQFGVSVIFGLALLFLTLHFINFHELYALFINFDKSNLFAFLFVSVCIFFTLTLRWKFILKAYGYKISFFKLLNYRFAGYAVSYLTPSAHIGGEPIRAYLLSKENIPMSKGLSSIIIDKSLEVTGDFLFSVMGVLVLLSILPIGKYAGILLGIGIAFFLWFLFSFFYHMYRGKPFLKKLFVKLRINKIKFMKKYESKINELEDNLNHFFQNRRKDLFIAIAFSGFLWILMFLEFYFALKILGIHATLMMIFMIVFVIGFTIVIPIPAAIGVMEAGQASLFSAMGFNPSVGVALGIMIHARDSIWVLLGLINIYFHGSEFLKQVINRVFKGGDKDMIEDLK